jgi:dipeptidyl aminopeptidase/acylaminoacyl peptidase
MRDVDVDADMFIWLGECQIGKNQITTFDGVVYDPRFVDECQYMVVAATGPDDKSVILLDRGSNAQNQVLALHFDSFAKHSIIRT